MRYAVVSVLNLSTLNFKRVISMKVAIIGSRNLVNVEISKYIPENVTEIISGGARGIDTLAEEWAEKNGIPKTIIKPEYERFKRGAPLKRNEKIVELADVIIALWDGKSRGTKFTIDYAKELKKEVKIYILEE